MSFDPEKFRHPSTSVDASALRKHVWLLIVDWLREKLERAPLRRG